MAAALPRPTSTYRAAADTAGRRSSAAVATRSASSQLPTS